MTTHGKNYVKKVLMRNSIIQWFLHWRSPNSILVNYEQWVTKLLRTHNDVFQLPKCCSSSYSAIHISGITQISECIQQLSRILHIIQRRKSYIPRKQTMISNQENLPFNLKNYFYSISTCPGLVLSLAQKQWNVPSRRIR
jgi:hypothetical protein